MSRNNGRAGAGVWIGAVFTAAAVIAAAWISGFSFSGETGKNFRALSDAFLAAGALATGIWTLSKIASTGFFDLFSYSFTELRNRLIPSRRSGRPEHFYDYKARAAESRKNRGYAMLFIGLGCVAASVLFLILFHSTNQGV